MRILDCMLFRVLQTCGRWWKLNERRWNMKMACEWKGVIKTNTKSEGRSNKPGKYEAKICSRYTKTKNKQIFKKEFSLMSVRGTLSWLWKLLNFLYGNKVEMVLVFTNLFPSRNFNFVSWELLIVNRRVTHGASWKARIVIPSMRHRGMPHSRGQMKSLIITGAWGAITRKNPWAPRRSRAGFIKLKSTTP